MPNTQTFRAPRLLVRKHDSGWKQLVARVGELISAEVAAEFGVEAEESTVRTAEVAQVRTADVPRKPRSRKAQADAAETPAPSEDAQEGDADSAADDKPADADSGADDNPEKEGTEQ